MKISVIVPVYNLENYIEATLNSIIQQAYPDLEIVVVDDGSSDRTPDIVDRFAVQYPSIKVIHQQNKGVTAARLTGIKNATGDYIGFVDGDDLIDPDMYDRLLSNAIKYDVDISHCGYRVVKKGITTFFYNTGELLILNHTDGLNELIEGSKIEPSLCNKLFRRRLFHDLIQCDQIDIGKKNNEDLLMNYYLFSAADRSVYEDFCPYQYIVRRGSASKQTVNRHILNDPIVVARTILNTIPKGSELYPVTARLYVTKLIRAATCYEQADDQEIVMVRKSAAKELRSFLQQYLSLKSEPGRRRRLAWFAAYLPRSYDRLHHFYLKRQEK